MWRLNPRSLIQLLETLLIYIYIEREREREGGGGDSIHEHFWKTVKSESKKCIINLIYLILPRLENLSNS